MLATCGLNDGFGSKRGSLPVAAPGACPVSGEGKSQPTRRGSDGVTVAPFRHARTPGVCSEERTDAVLRVGGRIGEPVADGDHAPHVPDGVGDVVADPGGLRRALDGNDAVLDRDGEAVGAAEERAEDEVLGDLRFMSASGQLYTPRTSERVTTPTSRPPSLVTGSRLTRRGVHQAGRLGDRCIPSTSTAQRSRTYGVAAYGCWDRYPWAGSSTPDRHCPRRNSSTSRWTTATSSCARPS